MKMKTLQNQFGYLNKTTPVNPQADSNKTAGITKTGQKMRTKEELKCTV